MENVKTNLGKTKGEIILELVKSLNCGDSCYASERVGCAIEQYEEMVEEEIIIEIEKETKK